MNNDRFFPKNNSARAAISLLLCVPLVAAAFLASRIDPNVVQEAAVQTLSVSSGTTVNTFSDQASLAIYADITKNAREIDASFRDFSLETPYEITFTESDGSEVTYSLYMLEDENDCIYKTAEDKYFMMDPESAKALLVRPEFTDVNSASFLPVLKFNRSGKELTLTPSSYDWRYKALDGSDVTTSSAKPAENPVIKFDSADIGAFTFDTQPDSMKVVLTNGSETLFDDVYENLPSVLSYRSDTKLKMTLTAEWYDIEGDADYSGTLKYELDALYDVKPTYSVVDDDRALPKGDFSILRISDFNDNELIEIENDIGIPSPAKVYDKADENIKFVFLPLMNTAENGKHTFTLKTEDGDVQTQQISVKDPRQAFGKKTIIVTDTDLQSAFTSEGFEEWSKTIEDARSASENAQLWEGKFKYPTGSAQVVAGGIKYGTELDIKSIYSKAYNFDGVQLAAKSGDDVKSSNSGKVVYAGELKLTGKTVLVDHGSGVITCYGNLSEINAVVGDAVTAESVIGKAGSTGFACNNAGNKVSMVYYAVNLGGVFIDPSSPCRFGIKF